jgi:glycerol-3-phosphate dehydrogenase
MKRDISTLTRHRFDIVVIGGGIHGAVIAFELALAGYKTLIIDQNDFSSATSANSFKIIHGGIRYLQDFDIQRMRESIYSRRYFLDNAPHLVKTLPCIMPVQKNSKIKPFMYRIALILNDLISWDRNRGLTEDKTIPRCRFLSISETTHLLPEVDVGNFSGAISWHDAIACDSERLVLYFIEKAVSYGAIAANYITAQKINTNQNRVCGITARCQFSDEIFDIHAKMVINCTGPWLYEIPHPYPSGSRLKQEYALALNLVVEPFLSESYAVGIEGEGGYRKEGSLMKKEKRLFFFVPWHGKTMIGTYYRKYHGSTNDFSIGHKDINAFVGDIHNVYPLANITAEKICFYHAGLVPIRPMGDESNSSFTLKKHTEIIDHDKKGGPRGLISVDSTKYTTAAITAKNLLKHLENKNEPFNRSGLRVVPVESRYARPDTAQDLLNHLPLKTDEIQRFVDKEMALTLSDIIFRRTNLGALENLSDDVLKTLAQRMGKVLGWNETKIVHEIEAVKQYFLPLKELREKHEDPGKKHG